MKFTYSKFTPKLVISDTTPSDVHTFSLAGGDLEIIASADGVQIRGESQLFQPVDEERKIPEYFREFLVRVDSAFELAFKEQEKQRKEAAARRSILGGR
jgi:hypothetical protein